MTPPVSEDLKQLIVTWYLQEDLTYRELSERSGCSLGLVAKVLGNFLEYGTVNNDHTMSKRRGRPPTADEGDIEYLLNLVDEDPVLYLDEIQEKLFIDRHTHLSVSSILRLLHRYGLSRKKVQKTAAERDEELRRLWEIDMAEYADPDMFVALDESAVDNHTSQRRYGRSRTGTPCMRRAAFLRGVRYSILPALSTQGIIALDIFEGSVTKERFLEFIREQVCPLLNPYPQHQSAVILDNCAIHHDEELCQLIEECEARLIYLPPYSPDFNPIEEAFSAIKAFLKRFEKDINANNLQLFIHQAATMITQEHARGWFADCGY